MKPGEEVEGGGWKRRRGCTSSNLSDAMSVKKKVRRRRGERLCAGLNSFLFEYEGVESLSEGEGGGRCRGNGWRVIGGDGQELKVGKEEASR